jgi:dTDP-4-amino-4,6-dideoxygalactose transaminase/nucleoside-diphosphate-sugar epimerase
VVLVTGGAGFVGSALVESLLKRGHSVISLDVGAADRLPEGHRGLRVVTGDVRDTALVRGLVAEAGLVLHLAAVVGVHDYITRPDEVLDVNIFGTRNVLRACLEFDRPVLLVSTSEAYGKNSEVLHEGADTVLGPTSNRRWSYAVSKLASEHIAMGLAARGLCFSAVRYFNVYGPTLDRPGAGRVLSQFIGQLQKGEPLRLVDGGHAVRSFCYIDDAVEATLRLALTLSPSAPQAGRVVNVGRVEPVSMRELAAMVLRLTGHPQGTVDVPGNSFFGSGFEEIPSRVPDVRALRETVGFSAEIGLEEGLRRTLAPWGLLAEQPGAVVTPAARVTAIQPVLEPDDALLATLRGSLQSGRVSNDGPVLRRFEEELARWMGVPDVVAVTNGAMALVLASKVLGLRGKVVLPSFTYIATLSGFTLNGLEPVFCDVDPETFTLSPAALERVLAAHADVAAVVPVNVYGAHAALEPIAALTAAAGAALVYDNSHGLGTKQHGARVPAQPVLQTFSLHATKILPAVEGGVLVGADPRMMQELRRVRSHGLVPANVLASTPGYNARLDELRAAVGLHSLKRLDDVISRRRDYAARLRATLARECGDRVVPQREPAGMITNGQNLGVRFVDAEQRGLEPVIATMDVLGVEGRRYFHPALHELDAYRGRVSLPVTERLVRSVLCLPLHSRMTEPTLRQIEAAVCAGAASVATASGARSA